MAARLQFYYGTMGSGKSTMALQIHHNLASRGKRGLMMTGRPRHASTVRSRLGAEAAAEEIEDDQDLFARIQRSDGLEYVVLDEAHFISPAQVEQLAKTVDLLSVEVYAFGLLTDFRSKMFPGSARLIELSDKRMELAVESLCWCGAPAILNARLVDGRQVYDGETFVVGDLGQSEVSIGYDLVCRRHWMDGRRPPT